MVVTFQLIMLKYFNNVGMNRVFPIADPHLGRLLRLDLCRVWKCFHVDVDVGLVGVLELAGNVGTRGHDLKLSVPICRSEMGRRIFGTLFLPVWWRLRVLNHSSVVWIYFWVTSCLVIAKN